MKKWFTRHTVGVFRFLRAQYRGHQRNGLESAGRHGGDSKIVAPKCDLWIGLRINFCSHAPHPSESNLAQTRLFELLLSLKQMLIFVLCSWNIKLQTNTRFIFSKDLAEFRLRVCPRFPPTLRTTKLFLRTVNSRSSDEFPAKNVKKLYFTSIIMLTQTEEVLSFVLASLICWVTVDIPLSSGLLSLIQTRNLERLSVKIGALWRKFLLEFSPLAPTL
jgi:hypothetical protein